MFIDLIFLQLTKLIWKIFNYNFKVIELNQTNNDSHITIWNNFKWGFIEIWHSTDFLQLLTKNLCTFILLFSPQSQWSAFI